MKICITLVITVVHKQKKRDLSASLIHMSTSEIRELSFKNCLCKIWWCSLFKENAEIMLKYIGFVYTVLRQCVSPV